MYGSTKSAPNLQLDWLQTISTCQTTHLHLHRCINVQLYLGICVSGAKLGEHPQRFQIWFPSMLFISCLVWCTGAHHQGSGASSLFHVPDHLNRCAPAPAGAPPYHALPSPARPGRLWAGCVQTHTTWIVANLQIPEYLACNGTLR
jgi:hypothetical protein